MKQFDVYTHPTVAKRNAFPYFVVLQSDQPSQFSTRLVMPLARVTLPLGVLPRHLLQTVEVAGEKLFLAPLLCAALPERLLRKPVQSLKQSATVFADSLDAVISGV